MVRPITTHYWVASNGTQTWHILMGLQYCNTHARHPFSGPWPRESGPPAAAQRDGWRARRVRGWQGSQGFHVMHLRKHEGMRHGCAQGGGQRPAVSVVEPGLLDRVRLLRHRSAPPGQQWFHPHARDYWRVATRRQGRVSHRILRRTRQARATQKVLDDEHPRGRGLSQ